MASFFSKLFGREEPEQAPDPAPQQTSVPQPAPVAATEDTGIYPDEHFSVLQSEIEGSPVVGTVNKGYKDYGRKAEYPWCLHIGIILQPENVGGDGLAGYDENSVAYSFEDELLAAIRQITTTHFIGHWFYDGFLDVYAYLHEPARVHEYLQSLTEKGTIRNFGYEINNDPDWDEVKGFLR